MKKEIRKFFDDKGLETHKLVQRNPMSLDRRQIEHGMKAVYYRFSEGEHIKDIQIAREVWNEAQKHKGKHHKDLELEYEEQKITDLAFEVELYKSLFVQSVIVFSLFFLAYILN